MRDKVTKSLFITGSAIIVLCLFLPVATTCSPNAFGYFGEVKVRGYSSTPFYISLSFLIYIVIAAFFRKNPTAKIVVIIFTLIGIAVSYYSLIKMSDTLDWGNNCSIHPTGFQYLLNFGHLLILVAAFIKVFTKREVRSDENDLLDNF